MDKDVSLVSVVPWLTSSTATAEEHSSQYQEALILIGTVKPGYIFIPIAISTYPLITVHNDMFIVIITFTFVGRRCNF